MITIFSFLTAFIISIISGYLVINWYKKNNWLDDPKKHIHIKNTHLQPIPRGGGIVVFSAIFLASIFWLNWDTYLVSIMMGALILTIVGWWDDVADIHPFIRLGANLLASLIVIFSGIGIAYITNPLGGVIFLNWPSIEIAWLANQRPFWLIADSLALLFIIWNMNIVNWSKGVAGQLPAFVMTSFLVLSLVAGKFLDDPTNFDSYLLTLICAGAFAGLLFWNWHPQKMMPGYGAGTLAGYFLAIIAIISGAKVAAVVMVLAIPTADAIFTIARRIYRKKPPYWGDRGHLHHKLMDQFGWSPALISVFYSASSLFFGLLALYLPSWGKLISLAIAGILVLGLQIEAKRRSLR